MNPRAPKEKTKLNEFKRVSTDSKGEADPANTKNTDRRAW